MRESRSIPVEVSNELSAYIKTKTIELIIKGYSFDSVEIYLNTALNIGLYQAEIDMAIETM